jgi:chloride channel protein, CIC family
VTTDGPSGFRPGSWRNSWLPSAQRRHELREQWKRVLIFAALTGVVVGLGVSAFEWITVHALLDHIAELPNAAQIAFPAVGLLTAALVLRWLGHRATPSTSEEYTRAYHDPERGLDLRSVPARMLASIATLGTGGAMGYEGPSIYLGAAVGTAVQRRFATTMTRDDRRVLLVAGAAAGIAAIFKAPATGALFALEVPYQDDTASNALLPALVAAATSYLTYVAFYGTAPLLSGSGNPGFDARDLLGSLALGLVCGVGARLFVRLVLAAKHGSLRIRPSWRILAGGGGLAIAGGLSVLFFDQQVVLGPGYRAITWSLSPDRALWAIAALFVLDAAATALTVLGGGAGGLFIPLVTQGWLLGRFVEGALTTHTALFPVVGAAAFLGAGYRTPIAAVMFVAETTGGPGFIVPALLATAIAQLVMGTRSISENQRVRRVGPIERRLLAPVGSVVVTDPTTCDADTPLPAVLALVSRLPAGTVPVLDGGRYVGMLHVVDVLDRTAAAVPGAPAPTAGSLVRVGAPVADEMWTLRRALAAMEAANADQLAVVRDGELVGTVTASAILRLFESEVDG